MKNLMLKIFFFTVSTYCVGFDASAIDVEVVYAKQETRQLELTLSGNVEAFNNAQLASLEAGVVKTIRVDAGEHVKTGQTLIELDDSLARIQLSQAKAEYQTAIKEHQEDIRQLNEIKGLAKKQVVAKTLLAEREATAAISKARITEFEAKVNLQQEVVNRHILVAPFTGYIAERKVNVGEWISQQSQFMQLVSVNALRIFVNIPQEYFDEINTSSAIKVLVNPDSSIDETIELSLSKFIAVSDPVSRTFRARIDLPDNTRLVAGMSAKVRLILPRQEANQVTLPKNTLKRHPDGSYSVYSVKDNKVHRISVQLLSSNLDKVMLQGIPDNSAIIISGSDLLIEGAIANILTTKGTN